ncbi:MULTISPECIES: Rrf2 family transcriptional regulator [Halococcus]|uniref:Transcriptional regulator n=1 Tax=Halococcus salifodinae DSM 8989 TaxID=1227456 RepID=M0MSF2_9EURY|nr:MULTISPECIES: Rrf2 family transcriptional regulator [Halococcus]EMA48657.1 transcriptional regulator [Halococcus salifodinae DSM 8989]
MSSIELTDSQKKVLQTLVDLYRESETAIKGESVAEMIDRKPGTIRNQMQSLKALQLVKGVSGPKGGYKPTANAYNALDIQEMDEPASVPLTLNDERIEAVNVQEIDFLSVHHPEKCRAEIHIQGSTEDFQDGDTVTVGPTPKSRLAITGRIDGIVDTDNILVLDTESMDAPVDN